MIPLWVRGLGLWAPGFADVSAWAGGRSDPEVAVPKAAFLPAALRRRSSTLTRMAAEAFRQAAAGTDPAAVPTVWASAYGEIETAVEILGSLVEPGGLPSPTRFHNSVHNTAAGTVSIAEGNRAFSTTLAAGPQTVAAGFVETAALLAERGGDAVLVLFDEPPPAPYAPSPPWPPLAVAFHLSAAPAADARAVLSGWRRGRAPAPAVPAPFEGHPLRPALGVLEAVLGGPQAGPCALEAGGDEGWRVDVGPGEAT